MKVKRYIVMSTQDRYGSFTIKSGGDPARPEVLALCWASGRSGEQAATKFETHAAARFAITQLVTTPSPVWVEEIEC